MRRGRGPESIQAISTLSAKCKIFYSDSRASDTIFLIGKIAKIGVRVVLGGGVGPERERARKGSKVTHQPVQRVQKSKGEFLRQ